MRKIIMAINTTPDGFCDHRPVIADDELHKFYADLVANAGTMLFGRKTFQLLESYWPAVAKNKTGSKADIEFAEHIEEIEKIVFSKAGLQTEWKHTRIINDLNAATVNRIKEKPGKDILVGSPSIVDQLVQMNMIDEYIFVVHPIIAGDGKRFFETTKLTKSTELILHDTKFLKSGVIALHYLSAK